MFRRQLAIIFVALICSICIYSMSNRADAVDESLRDGHEPKVLTLGDSKAGRPVSVKLSDNLDDSDEISEYPSQACYNPGWPPKPKWKRPGDINLKDCPPQRYRLDDCERSGHPHCIAPWAKCSITEGYSAWYVGGGTAWLFPRHARQRRPDEGTWGLDYDGLLRPRRVWLNWSCDRHQSTGTYETD